MVVGRWVAEFAASRSSPWAVGVLFALAGGTVLLWGVAVELDVSATPG